MNPIIKEEVELHVTTIRLESEVRVDRIEGISCSSSSLGEEEKTSWDCWLSEWRGIACSIYRLTE